MIIAFMVDDMGIVIVLKNFSICRVDDMAAVGGADAFLDLN